MRPGFLAGTTYWFSDIEQPAFSPSWLRYSSQPADETQVEWYNEFWVEEPIWEQYLK